MSGYVSATLLGGFLLLASLVLAWMFRYDYLATGTRGHSEIWRIDRWGVQPPCVAASTSESVARDFGCSGPTE